MPRLYTYCIPYDDGAAPNPFWGICTLAICKPAIRRTAEVGDWVVGTGSCNTPNGDMSNKVVYAMRVTDKLTMADYDSWTKDNRPKKIPDWKNADVQRRLGDSIYDYSTSPPKQRRGVHSSDNIKTDLNGHNVLLSKHYFYFGDKPIPLPPHLLAIVNQRQSHRVKLNEPFYESFLKWIDGLGLKPNKLYGEPAYKLFGDEIKTEGASIRAKCAEEDTSCPPC